MNLFKNRLVVGLLAVAALVVVFNALWPLLHRPSTRGPQQNVAPLPVPVSTASAPVQPSTVSAAAQPSAAPTNKPLAEQPAQFDAPRVNTTDLAVAQTNSARWTGSPQRDPFQMRYGTNRNAFPSAMELLKLSAVWRQSGGALAVINNRVVSEGDTMLDFTIETIGVERVWVNGPNGREQVVFDYAASSALRTDIEKIDSILDGTMIGQDAGLDWPYRIVGGVTNNIGTDKGWYTIQGKVQQVIGPGSYLIAEEPNGQLVIVKNVPLDRVDEEPLPSIRCKRVTTEEIEITSSKKTVRGYDYGVPCPPSAEEINRLREEKSKLIVSLEAQRAFLRQRSDEVSERQAKFDTEAAEKGNAFAQYTLGNRYLHGEGVPKDEKEARPWLEKSAAQGNLDAQAALQKIGAPK